MVMHGNNKTTEELTAALEAGVGRVVLDSFVEIARLAFLPRSSASRQRVLVRVTVGVEAHTHEFIATAHEDQKFGFSLDERRRRRGRPPGADPAVPRARRPALAHRLADLRHGRASRSPPTGWSALAEAIRDEHGIEIAELNLGGGLGIAYVSGDDPADLSGGRRRACAPSSRGSAGAAGLPCRGWRSSQAAASSGPSTFTLYEVGTVKEVELGSGLRRTFVSVDGGMSDNIRTALYDAEYTVVLASRASTAAPMLARVVGRHCESGDIVVKDTWLPADLAPGDLLAVAGDRGVLPRDGHDVQRGRPRLRSVAVGAGEPRLLLRRETLDDLLSLDMDA